MNYSRRQLYALGEPLGDAVTRKVGGKVVYGMGGGGGGGPTQQTVVQSNIPDWLRPQVETVLGGAMQQLFETQPGEGGKLDIKGVRPFIPYSANPADYVAGFSPLQQEAMSRAAGLQVPGQFDAATQMSGMAGQGGLDVARQAGLYGGAGFEAGQAGQELGEQARRAAVQQAGQAQQAAYGYGGMGADYGGMGAGYGAQAAGLAPQAQMYGGRAADIGLGALGAQRTGADVGDIARQYAARQAGVGADYAAGATSPAAMQSYMSPYMQNVVDVQQQAAQRQADIANQATQAQFARAGAFGGARHNIQQAQAAADLARQKQGIQAQGLQQAFQQAQQAQQFGAGLGLQGLAGAQQGLGNILSGGQLGLQGIGQAIAGQQAGLSGLGQAGQMYGLGMQGAGLGMQGAGMGLQGVGQAINAGQLGLQGAGVGLQGTAQGMQGAGMGLQGAQSALGGYGLLGQQAGVMGNLGAQELAARQGIIGLQSQLGGLEQQREQNIINQAIQTYSQGQQNPMQQYNAFNALLRGYAIPGQTSTMYQAAPSMPAQLAGLGMGAYGLSRAFGSKKGGVVKSMAEGGYTGIDDKVRNNPTKYSEEQIKRSTANDVIDPQTAAIALSEIARAKKAAAGISALSSGLPAQGFAPGGIVAFEDGGKVERYQNQGLVRLPNESFQDFQARVLKELEEQKQREAAAREAERQRLLAERGGPLIPPSPFFNRTPLPDVVPAAAPTAPAVSVAGAPVEPLPETRVIPSETGAQRGAPPAPSAPRQAPPSTAPSSLEDILERVKLAQERAMSPAEIMSRVGYDPTQQGVDVQKGLAALAAPNLPNLTPEQIRKMRQEAMPQGREAYESALTPEYQAMREASEKAAKEQLEERQKISDRLDTMRVSQEARYRAKEKDLETDRSRSVGIAFLEAAQAMTQPGQSFLQGLTRSAAAGGRRMMEDKERLDKRADALTDALVRLDEARLGDARERAGAQNEYNQALLGARKAMLDHMQSNFSLTRNEAATTLDTILKRQTDQATLQQRAIEAQQSFLLGAERNRLAGVGVGIEALKAAETGKKAAGETVTDAMRAEAALEAARRPTAQVELFRILGDGDVRKGYELAQETKLDPRKGYLEYMGKMQEIRAKSPFPENVQILSYPQYLATLNIPTAVSALPTGAREVK